MLGVPNPAAAVFARSLAVVIVLSVLAALSLGLVAAPAAHARKSASLDRQERRVIKFVNNVRGAHGLKRLRISRGLNRAANAHSWSMIAYDFFSHSSRDGTASSTRIRRYKKARRVGETLAYVRSSKNAPWNVVGMWMRSPGHRAILLSSSFRRIGVARQKGRFGSSRAVVFTADLSSRR